MRSVVTPILRFAGIRSALAPSLWAHIHGSVFTPFLSVHHLSAHAIPSALACNLRFALSFRSSTRRVRLARTQRYQHFPVCSHNHSDPNTMDRGSHWFL